MYATSPKHKRQQSHSSVKVARQHCQGFKNTWTKAGHTDGQLICSRGLQVHEVMLQRVAQLIGLLREDLRPVCAVD